MVKNRAVGDFSLPPGTLCINQIVVHNLHSSIPNVVHSLYPQHLILDLKLFCDAFTGRHLLNQLKKHRFSLFIQIGKITVQLAGDLQLRVQRFAVLQEKPQMPLPPYADGTLFFIGQLQTWNEIIGIRVRIVANKRLVIFLYVAHEKREYIPQGSEACALLFFQHAPDRATADAQAFRSPGLIHFLCQVHPSHDLAIDFIQTAAQVNGVTCHGEGNFFVNG